MCNVWACFYVMFPLVLVDMQYSYLSDRTLQYILVVSVCMMFFPEVLVGKLEKIYDLTWRETIFCEMIWSGKSYGKSVDL